MISVIFKKEVYKHGYLLIIAAWLFTLSFIISHYWAYDASPSKVQEKLSNKISKAEHLVETTIADSALLESLLSEAPSTQKLHATSLPFGLFLYVLNDVGSPILTYWNSNNYIISPSDLQRKDGYCFGIKQNGEHEIIKKTCKLSSKTVLLFAEIPIRWDYFVNNKYLQTQFDGFPSLQEQYEITTDADAFPVKNSKGLAIFKIKQKPLSANSPYDLFTICLGVCCLLLIILFIHRVATDFVVEYSLTTGLFFLIGIILVLRLLSYQIAFPFNVKRLPIFDPSIYASNSLHPSLGHLFVNAVLLFWIVGFWKFNSLNKPTSKLYLHYPKLKYLNIALMLVLVFAFASTIETLVKDSKISFDVTHFFSLNAATVFSFITVTFLALGFYHLSHIVLRPLFATNTPLMAMIVPTAILGLVYITLTIDANTAIKILVLVWAIGYQLLMYLRKQDLSLSIQQSSFFIFWVMYFALSITLLISWQNQVVDLAHKKKMAERLVLQNDANGENVLSIALSNINTKLLSASFSQLQTELTNKKFKDSILNENFGGYLNRFETTIYTFNEYYQPLFNEDSTFTYANLSAIISNRSKPTSIPNLYTWQSEYNKINFVYSLHLGADNAPTGYFFVVARPKPYKSEALYPVLFSQSFTSDAEKDYGKAIYINGKLISKLNDYEFPLKINASSLLPFDFEVHTNGEFTELWYNAGSGKIVIIEGSSTRIIEVITLFAYLFFTCLVVIGVFHVGIFFLNGSFTLKNIRLAFRLNMRSQIHATVLFISVFSFIIIGTSTISFFTNRFNNANKVRLSNTIENISNEIAGKLQTITSQKLLDDTNYVADLGFVNRFEKDISDVSETHNVDINFYSLSGNLITSTQPHIYSKQLLNTKMHPVAYYHLQNDKRSRYIQSEKIGKLSYLSIYMPVVDDAGRVYAYLNIPYLNSQIELNEEISSFIATIINLNAFIFLIAGVIAYFITQRVVESFSIIANKMKEVNFGKKNEVISWNRNDEIGELVTEYNKMVLKLEQSAQALARSEREGAWREMARQVAHEIKNPLTPMKLSIQYLQRAIDNNLPNAKQLSQNVAKNLIEQIDELAKIASDFSQFANINNAILEEMDISSKLESIVQLYQQSSNVQVTYLPQQPVYIMGDKSQINRLFTNLLKNAIEAVGEEEVSKIHITQIVENNQIIILIQDNGKGIPSSIKERIFQPNFTTKTSGTGLGLAISRGIVEKHHGEISFITIENEGTTFKIVLPIIKH